jgi:hypothetical protein
MKAFLVGLGIGVGLGVLFAPMSGERTRENLAQKAGDLADSARDTFEQGRDRVQKGIGAIRNIGGGEGSQRRRGLTIEPATAARSDSRPELEPQPRVEEPVQRGCHDGQRPARECCASSTSGC